QVGGEVNFAQHWSAKAEWLYFNLGDRHFSVTAANNGLAANLSFLGSLSDDDTCCFCSLGWRALRRRWIDSHAIRHLRARQVALDSPGGPVAIVRFDKGPSSVEWREFSLDVPLFTVGQLSYRAVFIHIDERIAGIWHGCHFRRIHN